MIPDDFEFRSKVKVTRVTFMINYIKQFSYQYLKKT